MIKAVILDWGGVLIDEPTEGCVEFCAKHLGVGKEQLFEVSNNYFEDFQKAKLTEEEYWGKVCSTLNVDLPTVNSLWGDSVTEVFRWRPNVVALAMNLKEKGLKLGFLSNTEKPAVEFFKKTNNIPFDAMVCSCDCGLAKPQKEIYDLIIKRLEVAAKEAVFIDDRSMHVEGGKRAGLHTIQYSSFEQVVEELKKLVNF